MEMARTSTAYPTITPKTLRLEPGLSHVMRASAQGSSAKQESPGDSRRCVLTQGVVWSRRRPSHIPSVFVSLRAIPDDMSRATATSEGGSTNTISSAYRTVLSRAVREGVRTPRKPRYRLRRRVVWRDRARWLGGGCVQKQNIMNQIR